MADPSSFINSNFRFDVILALHLGRRAPAGSISRSSGRTQWLESVSLSRLYMMSAASSLVRIRWFTSKCIKTAVATKFERVDRTEPVTESTGVESK